MVTPILQTKLFVPRLRSKPIHRPRLVARLHAGLNGKFTLVSAPAGYGKTTLLLDWISHSQSADVSQSDAAPRFCWLSLESDDDEPVHFIRYLIAALQEVHDSLGQATLSLLQSPQPPPLQTIITSLLNELALVSSQAPIVLVLDDYHFIGNQAIHQAVTFLLDHAPPTFHLVITTRSDPPLPLAQMRVRGEMTEIRQADLRFTPQETGQFLDHIPGIALPPAEVTALAKRSEGWVAALQLATLALQGQESARQSEFVTSFSGSYAHVVDYLMDQVWQRQPDEVRRFWLATSVLDRLCAPLCDAVAERNDSRQMLDKLHRQNLFLIGLDNERQWFRYHRLFADMLRARAVDLDAATIRQLHRRAARWYEKQERLPQAVHHALSMDDQSEAVRLISLASEEALKQGQLQTIQKWLDALPAADVRAHHRLALTKAWVSYLTGDSEAAMDYLAAAQKAWPENAEPAQQVSRLSLQAFMAMLKGDTSAGIDLSHEALAVSHDGDEDVRQLILFNLMQAQAATGDIDGATRSGYKALQAGPDMDNAFLGANVLEGLLQLLLMQGNFQEGIRLGQEATARLVDKRGKALPVAGPVYVALGQLYLETGAVDRAYTTVQQGMELGQKMAAAMPIVNGKLRLAQIQTLRGEEARALATLDDLQTSTTWPQLNLIVAALQSEIHVRLGKVDAALAWANDAQIPSLDAPLLPLETVYLAYARCLLAGKQWSDADVLLAKLNDAAAQQGRAGSQAPIMVAQALSKQDQGQDADARDTLRDALLIAAPRGHKRPFLEDLPRLRPLLQDLLPSAPDFVADILGQSTSVSAADLSPLPDPLNEREIQILRLIDAGNTNPEIARELYLSVNTVKWYVKGIFQKLDVSSRKQAAARARDIGLLR